jgi:hypothetical protein
MAKTKTNKIIFCFNEADVRALAEEIGIDENRLTPEIMDYIKLRIGYEFRHFDSWMVESVIPDALETK